MSEFIYDLHLILLFRNQLSICSLSSQCLRRLLLFGLSFLLNSFILLHLLQILLFLNLCSHQKLTDEVIHFSVCDCLSKNLKGLVKLPMCLSKLNFVLILRLTIRFVRWLLLVDSTPRSLRTWQLIHSIWFASDLTTLSGSSTCHRPILTIYFDGQHFILFCYFDWIMHIAFILMMWKASWWNNITSILK